jgi:addiction module HigA family antidote
MQMHKPAHPGEVLKEMYLEPLDLSITQAAEALGVTRKALSELINGRTGISTAMALRLSKAFHTTPELWLNLQQNFDLWRERRKVKLSRVRVLVKGKNRIED